MGQPKKQRRKYDTPKHMWKAREGEKELVQAYGLKNARELWKAKSEVARIRGLARQLLAKPDEKTETDMLARLVKMGLIPKESKLEDVLNLTLEQVLDRRLQTVTYKKGLTISIKQARQEIVHGHIAVKGQRMTAPGHLTTLEEAEAVNFYAGSSLANPEHPIRNVEKKKASTEGAETRDTKAEDVKPPGERPAEEKKEEAKEEKPLPPAPEGAVVEETPKAAPEAEKVLEEAAPEVTPEEVKEEKKEEAPAEEIKVEPPKEEAPKEEAKEEKKEEEKPAEEPKEEKAEEKSE